MPSYEKKRSEIEADAKTEFAKHPDLRVEDLAAVGLPFKISVVRSGDDAWRDWDRIQEVSNRVLRRH